MEALRARNGGEIVWLRPWWARNVFPRRLVGLHRLRAVLHGDGLVDLHHVYAPTLDPMLLLRLVKRPVVYSVAAGVGSVDAWPSLAFLKRLGAIIVPSRADLDALRRRGLENAHMIRPGIDLSRFSPTPPPAGPDFCLLVGSAPWTRAQFESKGVDVLLQAAQEMRDLRLVFLWRGALLRGLAARIEASGLSERVEVVNEPVDVAQLLARVHAAVVLAASGGLVKAYPHSLLEALAAGRPVIMSDGIPMASYVREVGCGRVVLGLDPADLVEAIHDLRDSYEDYRSRSVGSLGRDFSLENFFAAIDEVYRALL